MSDQSSPSSIAPPPGSTSTGLLRQAKDMDDEAWCRIVRLYGPLVHAWCRKANLRESDLADVFQEVFAAAAQHITAFRRDRSGDTFRGWLRVITRNKIRDFFRGRGEPAGLGGSDAKHWLNEIADAANPIEESRDANESERAVLVRRALELIRESFDPQSFTAFWRTAVDGQSAPAVAEELGMSAAAVRKAKSRVLQRLRSELGDDLS